jgi:hypothetical protein
MHAPLLGLCELLHIPSFAFSSTDPNCYLGQVRDFTIKG